MSKELGENGEVSTCGISISADRTCVSIYLGGAEPGETFEFVMPKDLALHMANTIQKLASPAAKAFPRSHDPDRSRNGIVPGAVRQKDLSPGHGQSLWHGFLACMK